MFECLKYLINSDYYIVFYLYDGSILTGHENGYIKQWDLNNNELKLIGEKKVHDGEIRVISQLKNDLILSGSYQKINIYWININFIKNSNSLTQKICFKTFILINN